MGNRGWEIPGLLTSRSRVFKQRPGAGALFINLGGRKAKGRRLRAYSIRRFLDRYYRELGFPGALLRGPHSQAPGRHPVLPGLGGHPRGGGAARACRREHLRHLRQDGPVAAEGAGGAVGRLEEHLRKSNPAR